MRVFDKYLAESGLTWEELDECAGCQPTHWMVSETSGFNLCSYHEGFATGYEKGLETERVWVKSNPGGDTE